MSPTLLLLLLALVATVHAAHNNHLHHRRHPHPQPPPEVAAKFPRLDQILGRRDAWGRPPPAVAAAPTAAPVTTELPHLHQADLWKVRQAILGSNLDDDYEEDDYSYSDNTHMSDQGSNITAFKWETLGTREAVEKSVKLEEARQSSLQMLSDLSRDASCKAPQLRYLKVSDLILDHSKKFNPDCIKLHRCAKDTGCCLNPTHECGPKKIEKAPVILFATDVGTRRSSALKVHLDNHTECHCRPRALPPPTTAAPPPADSRTRAGRTAYFGDVAGAYQRHPASHKPVPVRENCVCPSRFTARNFANGTCTCDCFDRERDCLRLKKGRESFSVEDSDCIGDGRCRRPTCEFGEYLDVSDRGRCPLRDERIFPLYSRSEAQTRRALAPVVPPLPQPSWKWTPPDTPQGVPRVEVPSWAVHHHRIAWPAPRSQPTLPPPVVAPAWSRPTTAPPATTTNTPRPPWNPQPIRTTPSSFPLLGGKDSLVAASRYHLPSKWSLAGTIENGGGFAWNPEETMRHVSKHSSRKI
ncbi:Hypothetical predicted protein [Cloeon dipterum]|uniref:Platelet-derived growth factor (PDGF) family profile domain-containing protein n=2 Tax=Cloeon dipterum TaxID=197152 RepID=A0A8S1C3P9_9INSE|nr:Hypothetical predicted protein [Cloeon dipterum]